MRSSYSTPYRNVFGNPYVAGGSLGPPAAEPLTLIDWQGTTILNSTPLVADPPSNITAGDLLVILSGYENDVAHTADVAWTREIAQGGNGASVCLFWKIADGTETTVALTPGVAHDQGAVYIRFIGADVAPIGAKNSQTVASAPSGQGCQSLTTLRDNSIVLVAGHWDSFNVDTTTVTLTTDAGFTVGTTQYTPNGAFSAGLFWGYKQVPFIAGTGIPTATMTGANDGFVSLICELKQAL